MDISALKPNYEPVAIGNNRIEVDKSKEKHFITLVHLYYFVKAMNTAHMISCVLALAAFS